MYNTYAGSAGSSFLSFIIGILLLISFVIIFMKARRPGWAAIVPFYSSYCLAEITLGSGWYFLILLIPLVNILFLLFIFYRLAVVFGKGTLFAIFTAFFPYIALPIIAFGSSEYDFV